MVDLRIRASAATNLKPALRQTADIMTRPALAALMRSLERDGELKIIDYSEFQGHIFVVLAESIDGVHSGFFWEPSVEIYDADNPGPVYPEWDLGMDFESRIIRYMMDKHYQIADGHLECNIIYLEGLEPHGVPNANKLDHWNDLSCIIEFEHNKPKFALVPVRATTEPGWEYTMKPMNAGGAFRIALDQHRAAWKIGTHGHDYHPALEQVGEITGHRDFNKDGLRAGDKTVVGRNFYVNQHRSYTGNRVGVSSAGCMVRKNDSHHALFMQILKTDPRYKRDRSFCFDTTIICGKDFNNSQWGYGK